MVVFKVVFQMAAMMLKKTSQNSDNTALFMI